jgi:hypothetical protein
MHEARRSGRLFKTLGSTRRSVVTPAIRYQFPAVAPVIGLDFGDHDMREFGLLAQDAFESVGDLAHQLALLCLRRAVACNADMDEWHEDFPDR